MVLSLYDSGSLYDWQSRAKAQQSRPLSLSGLGSGITIGKFATPNPVRTYSSPRTYSSSTRMLPSQQSTQRRSSVDPGSNTRMISSPTRMTTSQSSFAANRANNTFSSPPKTKLPTRPTGNDPNNMSRWEALRLADLYGKVAQGEMLAQARFDASQRAAEIALQRADVQGALAQINAEADGAKASLAEARRHGMDEKVYVLKMLEIENTYNDRARAAIQAGIDTQNRQSPLIDAAEADANRLYGLTIEEINRNREASGRGVRQNRTESRWNTSGYDPNQAWAQTERSDIEKDYENVLSTLSAKETEANTNIGAARRDFGEQRATVRDNLGQAMRDMGDANTKRQQAELQARWELAVIDHRLRQGEIDAGTAAKQRSAAKRTADQKLAAISAQELNSFYMAVDAQMKAAQAADLARQQSILTNGAGTTQRQLPAWNSGLTTGWGQQAVVAPATQRSSTRTAPVPAFGQAGNPLTPSLTRVANSTNPLGIAQSEWDKIVWQAGVESNGDPVRKMNLIADYTKWFGAQMPTALGDWRSRMNGW